MVFEGGSRTSRVGAALAGRVAHTQRWHWAVADVTAMAEPYVLVVDADRTTTSLVHAGLTGSGLRVVEAHDGDEALRIIRSDPPAVALLAAQLPSRNGLDIVRWVRADAALGPLPIILLSARADATDRILGLELGADDFITKPFHPREVAARIKALLRRRVLDAGPRAMPVLRVGDLVIDHDRHEVRLGTRVLPLTPTEFRLLRTLMESPGRAFSRAELIDRALGEPFAGSARTLDSHMRNLRAKIETVPRRPRYIHTVFGVGYRLTTPVDGAADGAASDHGPARAGH